MGSDTSLRYPATREEIDITKYHKLVLRVLKSMSEKYGTWVYRHKKDLVQAGYIGLIMAKKKYQPGRGSFLGLAWYRIERYMQQEIARIAKWDMNVSLAEDIKAKYSGWRNAAFEWGYFSQEVIIDYKTILSMVKDEDDRKVLVGIIEGYPWFKLLSILGEGKEKHLQRIERLKEELVEILYQVHPQ